MLDFQRQSGTYLLIPVPPTPNGPMHLGHIAGPYLRTDILARRLRQHGDRAVVYTGTDDNDNYVTLKAAQLNIPPDEVCRKFHRRIAQDLDAMNIQVGEFIDTLDGEGRATYRRHMSATMEKLLATGFAVTRSEKILISADTNDALVGCWITGKCPLCKAHVAGYFCEACGTHFQPEEILDATPRNGNLKTDVRTVENIFLNIKDTEAHLTKLREMGASPSIIDIVARFFSIPGNQFRLTVPGTWGVSYGNDPSGFPRSIFSILWEIFVYGDLLAARNARDLPAYLSESTTKIILAFGVDNTIALLIGGVGVVGALPGCKAPEYALTNYFMNLEDEKFSTSRNHVIWAADIAACMEGRVDALRYYLCAVSPDMEVTNFSVTEFSHIVNQIVGQQVMETVRAALKSAHVASILGEIELDDIIIQRFKAAVVEQDHYLQPKQVLLQRVLAPISKWISDAANHTQQGTSAYWWAKAFACLVFPVMPELAEAVWVTLGHDGAPSFHAFLSIPKFGDLSIIENHHIPKIRAEDIAIMLPKKLPIDIFVVPMEEDGENSDEAETSNKYETS